MKCIILGNFTYFGWLMLRLVHLSLILSFFFTLVQAQEYNATHYSLYDGLPSPEIYNIAQDSLGRMLFASRSGFLISYDGFQWRHIGPKSNKQEHYGILSRLYVDSKNTLWATDVNSFDGIYYYRDKVWKRIAIPVSLKLSNEKPLSIHVIYQHDKPILLMLFSNRNLLLWQNNRFTYLNKKSLPTKNIQNILAVNKQFYLLDSNGLYTFNHKTFTKIHLPFESPKEPFFAFCKNERQTTTAHDSLEFFILTRNHLFLWGPKGIKKFPVNFPIQKLKGHQSYKMICDGFGGVFVGAPYTLLHFNTFLQKWETLKLSKTYSQFGITDIFKDRENNYWIATHRGVFKIPSLRFLNFTRGLSVADEITSIHEFSPGHYFFAFPKGFMLYDGQQFKTIKLPRDDSDLIRILTAIYNPVSQKILAVSPKIGLITISFNGNFSILPAPGDYQFNCIYPENMKRNRYLIGTCSGVVRLSGKHFEPLHNPVLDSTYIRRIYRDSHNTLYLATAHAGVLKISGHDFSEVMPIRSSDSAPKSIYAITELDTGRILVGTANGLYELRSDSLVKSPLFSKGIPIFSILTTRQGGIWLGTNHGVFRIPREHPNDFVHFDVRHGLSGMECNRDALYADTYGRIWIGTDNGLSLYQPSYDRLAPAPLVSILNTPPKNPLFHFGTYNDDWLVKFSCISFKDEKNITLRYRLKGLESWHTLEKLRNPEITYLQIPPGTYHFQLQAKNVEGNWSPVVESSAFTIYSPLWKRWYSLFFMALLFGSLIYFLIAIQYNKKLNRQLQSKIKEQTAALRKSEEKYRQLFLNSLDGIFITTPEGKFIDVNPAGVTFFGYESKEDLLRVNIPKDLYVNPEDRKRFMEAMDRKGYVRNFEADFKRKDGSVITAVLSSTCVYDDEGRVVAYSGYFRDITEWKRMKQQLAHSQRMESLGLLAGGIAHDFNNILAGILGYASLMKTQLNPQEKVHRFAEIIEKSAQRAAELTNQLLIFSRRGRTKLKAVNLGQAIEEALKIIRSTFPKNTRLTVKLEKNLPNVLADPTQIQQIIINLALNARDALPEGEGEITISACRFSVKDPESIQNPEAKPGDYVCLQVRDTGVGIPENIRQKIFEPFYSTKPKGKGTGMGLAMVYGAVRHLGGFIQVESEVNRGTTFALYFPIHLSKADEPEATHQATSLGGLEKILVVDDEETIRDFCKLALEKYGYQITAAENGKVAIEILETSKPHFDLVILDMIMPVMDGAKTYQKIRQKYQKLPILISSGYSEKRTLDDLKKDSLVRVIHKPFKAEYLAQNVRNLLDSVNHPL